jgi:DNA polymerase
VLRDENKKAVFWEDLKNIKAKYEENFQVKNVDS